MSTSTYPVHVDAQLDPDLSRGLWLVKWLLVIPHYVVLAFLWVAFAVLSVVAFCAIVVTGRYPRSIFEFNVGVLRWSWRVAYYAYGALGTDRYPPFSLAEHPEYPAQLHVDYPEHLSRGLVLVKWWLLAIPHYLVVGLFLSGGVYVASEAVYAEDPWLWGGGLIGLLALVAGVVLLFTGRYPQSVFDLLLGMNRWVLRVAGYASLMTDVYPPFRLDQGGDDPGTTRVPATGAPDAPAAAAGGPAASTVWPVRRVLAVVLGSVALVGSLGLAGGGAVLAIADTTLRDDAGFLMSDSRMLTTDAYAITSTDVELHAGDEVAPWPRGTIGDVKVTATSTGSTPVFVGVASSADVDEYLADVRRATLVDFEDDPVLRVSGRAARPVAPVNSAIWVARAGGSGMASLVWATEPGDWTLVVMNSDGSPGVTAAVALGATVPALDRAVPVLLSAGGTGLVLAVALLVSALRTAEKARRRDDGQVDELR